MTIAPSQHREFPALRDPRYPVHRIADQLEPCLRAIVEDIRPEQIILFGSQAYGEPNEHSDVDLLVVRRGIESELHSNLEIRRAMRDADFANLPFTILSKTPERIAEQLGKHSAFYEEIVGRGVMLYEAGKD
jgi:predicted nucleotidyltransferase